MKRWLALLAGLLLLGTGGGLWGLYALVEKGAAAKPFWEATLSKVLRTPVHIGSLASQRQGMWPALLANEVDLGPRGFVRHASLRVNPLHMLRVWALLPDRLHLEGVRLQVIPDAAPGQLMHSISKVGHIEISDAEVTYQTARQTVPLQSISLKLDVVGGMQHLSVFGHVGGLSFVGRGVGQLDTMDGTLHLELAGGALPPGLVFLGQGEARLALEARSGRLVKAGGSLDAESLILPLGERGVPFERIVGGFQWQHRDGSSSLGHLILRDVNVRMHGEAMTMKRLEVAGNPMEGGELFVEAEAIPMRILAQAAQTFAGQGGEALAALGDRGVVRNVHAAFPADGPMALQATADGLALQSPWGRMEETHGSVLLQGPHLRADLQQGRMVVTTPMLFGRATTFATHGVVEMDFADTRLAAFRLIDTHVENQDLAADLTLQLQLHQGESPQIQTKLQLQRARVEAMADYLPHAWVGEEVRLWLGKALRAGRIDGGHLELAGPLQGFPFRGDQGPGLFVASLQVHDATFDYAPPWPAITSMQGNITFGGPTLAVVIQQGRIAGTRIRQAVATMDDLRTLHLKVSADLEASMTTYLRFLKTAPFSQDMGWLDALWGKGDATAHLELGLPLHHDQAQHIGVATTMRGVEVGYGKSPLHVTGLEGTLRYEDGFFLSSGLDGQWGGAPLRATLQRAGLQSKILASGSLRGASAPSLLGLPSVLEGQAPWDLQLAFGHGAIDGALHSDLRGLAVALPEPLGKRAQEQYPLQLELHQRIAQPLVELTARYGKGSRVQLFIDEHGTVRRGTIGVGTAPASLPVDGLALRARLPHLAVSDVSMFKGSSAAGLALPWREVRLDVGRLDLGAGHRGPLVVRMQREASGDWRGTVAGQLARGILQRQGETWRLQLDHLQLPQDTGAWSFLHRDGGTSFDAARPWPSLEMKVDHLQLGERPLGHLQVQGISLADGGSIEATWRPPGGRIEAQVGCTRANQPPCSAALELHALQEQAFWQALQPWVGGLRAKSATVGFAGEYPARSAHAGSLPGLPDGALRFAIRDGVIEDIKPGAGKLLGILGLHALSRRLRLDFSDLREPGLAFNSIKGSFEIHQGVATTRDTTLLGPIGRMASRGWVDLGRGQLDQHLEITPGIGAELALGGLIAGGPVVGGAMLLAGTVLHKPLGALTTLRYHVHGDWSAPVIEKEKGRLSSGGKRTSEAFFDKGMVPGEHDG